MSDLKKNVWLKLKNGSTMIIHMLVRDSKSSEISIFFCQRSEFWP